MSKLLLLAGAVAAVAAGSTYNQSRSRAAAVILGETPIERTVWDSVYTDSQAVRGDSVYKATCVKCHGVTLAGGDDGGPLTGLNFLGNWNGLPVGDLYDKIRTTMPPDKPKSIPPTQLADVVAYVLAQNHFPAGTRPLVDDADSLKAIKIVQSKP